MNETFLCICRNNLPLYLKLVSFWRGKKMNMNVVFISPKSVIILTFQDQILVTLKPEK